MFSPQSVGALERNLRNLPIQIDPFLLNSSSMDQKKKHVWARHSIRLINRRHRQIRTWLE